MIWELKIVKAENGFIMINEEELEDNKKDTKNNLKKMSPSSNPERIKEGF